jgi:hypothetical protein
VSIPVIYFDYFLTSWGGRGPLCTQEKRIKLSSYWNRSKKNLGWKFQGDFILVDFFVSSELQTKKLLWLYPGKTTKKNA